MKEFFRIMMVNFLVAYQFILGVTTCRATSGTKRVNPPICPPLFMMILNKNVMLLESQFLVVNILYKTLFTLISMHII